MKLGIETLAGRRTREIESLTITGTLIVAGNAVIAEIGVEGGQICWLDAETKEPLAWLEVT
jgi:hypothetical protein